MVQKGGQAGAKPRYCGHRAPTAPDLSRFAGAVEAVTPARIQEYLAALPPEWSAADAVANTAADHLSALRDNIEAAITEVTRVLS